MTDYSIRVPTKSGNIAEITAIVDDQIEGKIIVANTEHQLIPWCWNADGTSANAQHTHDLDPETLARARVLADAFSKL